MLGPRTLMGHPRLGQERLVPVSIDHCINAFAVSTAFHAPAMQEAELLSYYMTASIKINEKKNIFKNPVTALKDAFASAKPPDNTLILRLRAGLGG